MGPGETGCSLRRFTVLPAVITLTGGDEQGTDLSGRVVFFPIFPPEEGGGGAAACGAGGVDDLTDVRSGLIGVSEGMVTGTDMDLKSFLFSVLSSTLSSIFLFLMPGLAGLMGEGRQEDKEETPSGLTEQKMQGS